MADLCSSGGISPGVVAGILVGVVAVCSGAEAGVHAPDSEVLWREVCRTVFRVLAPREQLFSCACRRLDTCLQQPSPSQASCAYRLVRPRLSAAHISACHRPRSDCWSGCVQDRIHARREEDKSIQDSGEGSRGEGIQASRDRHRVAQIWWRWRWRRWSRLRAPIQHGR